MKRAVLFQFLIFMLISAVISAQTTTRTNDSAGNNPPVNSNGKANVLVIPWHPKMFNGSSDVTKTISANTGQNYNQIQEALRKGMCDQFRRAFSGQYNVTTLLDDTAKMKVDLMYCYNVTTTEYIPVNSPLNPVTAPQQKGDAKKGALKTTTGVKNGQVQVEQQEGEKFMNTVIISPNLLAHLKKNYNCDYVIFMNQMDLQNELGSDPYNTVGSTDFKRSATLHYTIFNTATGKRVAMGKAKGLFSNNVNTSKKIIDQAFAPIGTAVFNKFKAALAPAKPR
jgi:hypothetical protein